MAFNAQAAGLPQNQFVTADEAARFLNVTPRHIYKQCAKGNIKAVKVGACWRIPRTAFLRQFGAVEEACA